MICPAFGEILHSDRTTVAQSGDRSERVPRHEQIGDPSYQHHAQMWQKYKLLDHLHDWHSLKPTALRRPSCATRTARLSRPIKVVSHQELVRVRRHRNRCIGPHKGLARPPEREDQIRDLRDVYKVIPAPGLVLAQGPD
ncbi:hypothetical protein JANAI62_13030 [Jannaschia pagri]|uniref:Uncharacterized protein n=1 Tax=Jannaschia pagri TaxID=2829797 RepID=A0ABQ4NKB3_9RHOB|nr:hypothetical protein JANAI61_13060 [Jannaschia sp. AI_61]GIT94680.1 hypothetical protein JANAI62_13030 [Jannaschia sp. AI_62]